MSLPGFSAINSVGASTCPYYGAATLSAGDGEAVRPQFLGSIGEAVEEAAEHVAEGVEHIAEWISGAFSSALSDLRNLINSLKNHGGPNGAPFICGFWVTQIMSCSGTSPTYSYGEVLTRCVGANPQSRVVCGSVVSAMYPLLSQACRSGNSAELQGIGSVCQGA